MIRTIAALKARVAEGETVCVMPDETKPGSFRTCITSTGQTVFKSALKKLVESGDLKVIHFDIAGEPMQWGRA
jgi:hypothetical protein